MLKNFSCDAMGDFEDDHICQKLRATLRSRVLRVANDHIYGSCLYRYLLNPHTWATLDDSESTLLYNMDAVVIRGLQVLHHLDIPLDIPSPTPNNDQRTAESLTWTVPQNPLCFIGCSFDFFGVFASSLSLSSTHKNI